MAGEECWSEALQATHLALSEEDLRFRDFARQNPALLRRATFHALDGELRIKYRKQPWPTFVGRAKLDQLKSLGLAVAALIRSLPRRIFANDPAKICEFYNLPSREVADIILSEPNCIEGSMARGDMIDTANGFKCIEFNFSPNLGGWENVLLAELQEKISPTADFLERAKIRVRHTSTLRVLFGEILSQAERQGICERGALNVACAVDPDRFDDPWFPEVLALFQRELDRSCGERTPALFGKVIACRYDELIAVQGKLFCKKVRVHAVLELCAGHAPAHVYRLFKAGRLLLFNGPIEDVLSEKRNIALLSANDGSGAFSPAEQEIIRNNIPWTRLVLPETVRFRDQEVWLPDLLSGHRERLVLKEGMNFGGQGVFLGRSTAASRWDELVQSALASGGWVVQEHLESLPYLYQHGEYGCAAHDVVWGPFVLGKTYGGVILRMQPQAVGGAINLHGVATEGIVFEV